MGTFYEIASNGRKISNVNSSNIVEITDVTDFPGGTGLGAVISLAANTTYLIRGEVDILLDRIDVQVDGACICGRDRSKDCLKSSTGTGTMITVGDPTLATNTEYNFTLDSLRLSAPEGKVLDAANLDITEPDGDLFGRTAVLAILNCEFRYVKNVFTITGFELVDMINNLIWFVSESPTLQPSLIGCQFRSVRHIEMTSNETFNWFKEGTNPKTGYSAASMIEILPDVISTGIPTDSDFGWVGGVPLTDGTPVTNQPINGSLSGTGGEATVEITGGVATITITSSGGGYVVGETISIPSNTTGGGQSEWGSSFTYTLQAEDFNNQFNAVVNVSGAIIHPESSQIGFEISDSSETKFGTITGNTFIPAGLTTGSLIDIDYDIQNSYIINSNQSVRNSNATGILTVQSNLVAIDPTVVTPTGTLYENIPIQADSYEGFVPPAAPGNYGPTNDPQFFNTVRVNTSEEFQRFTYVAKSDSNFTVSLSATVEVSANGTYELDMGFLQNGVALPFKSSNTVRVTNNIPIAVTFGLTIQGLAVEGDEFQVYLSYDNGGAPVSADFPVIKEMTVSGFSF